MVCVEQNGLFWENRKSHHFSQNRIQFIILEAEDPFSSGFLYLDCWFREMLDDWQFTYKEGLDIGLGVKCASVMVNWLNASLSGCYGFVFYGFGFFGVSWVMP